METRDFYFIKEMAGKKILHYREWVEPYEGMSDIKEPWSIVESDCIVPLADIAALPAEREARRDYLANAAASVRQYQTEVGRERAELYVESAWGEAACLPLESLTADAPCGEYWF